jgi:hypothetical protein
MTGSRPMPMGPANCGMQIGDLVLYLGRSYVLLGLDPMGLPDRCAELEDPRTGARFRVPLSALTSPHEPAA